MEPHLKVSRALVLSNPERQKLFYEWMDRIPVVQWFPWLSFVMALGFPLKHVGSGGFVDGCGWWHIFMALPMPVLAVARMSLENNGCSKQAQSIASTLMVAYPQLLNSAMTALDDPCYAALGPSLKSSPAAAAAFAAAMLLHFHAAVPCTMEHFYAVCSITVLGSIATVYPRYLWHNGGLTLGSDPYYLGLIAITISTVASLAVAAALRLLLVQRHMVGFLRSIRP